MTRLACVLAVLVAGCAKPQLVLYDPGDPALVKKLGLSAEDWPGLQAQINSHLARQDARDLRVIHWGRSNLTGDIEVWCAHTAPTSPTTSGPVFFFRRIGDRWHIITEEMSVWGDP
jgi:hypothetical protein